jgi:hypothetical protein
VKGKEERKGEDERATGTKVPAGGRKANTARVKGICREFINIYGNILYIEGKKGFESIKHIFRALKTVTTT